MPVGDAGPPLGGDAEDGWPWIQDKKTFEELFAALPRAGETTSSGWATDPGFDLRKGAPCVCRTSPTWTMG
jgi:hypothetical protein